MQQIKLQLQSLQQDLQDFKEFERNKPKIREIGRKKFGEEIAEELKKGKDLKTVLREKLDTDVLISRVEKEGGKLPRITRELLIEDLIAMKSETDPVTGH